MAARLRGETDAPEVEQAREDLLAFAALLKPDYEPHWFHRLLAERLEAFAAGAIERLIVSMPPQHGKTELVSRLFPAWLLGLHPDTRIIAGSYNDEAATRVNLDVQRYIDSEGYARVFPATRLPAPGVQRHARHRRERRTGRFFEVVGRRGYYRSAGRGSGISGVPGDVGLIDDPLKDRAEAESATVRSALWDWYTGAFLTRLRKSSRQLVVMTRWHEDDLIGRLLDAARRGGPQWEVLRLPAFAETLQDYPRHADDPRADGEALWPTHFPVETLRERRVSLGSYQFDGLYQQRPTAPGGTEFKREHVQWLDAPPDLPGVRRCRAWDCGATEGGGDWTSGVRVARVPPCVPFPKGAYVVEDVRHEQWGPGRVDALIVETAERDGRACLVREEQEPGSAGKAVITARGQRLRERGYSYEGVPSTHAKEVRRLPARALWEAGLIWLVRGAWAEVFMDELARLPGGAHDDQADAFAHAVNTLTGLATGLGGEVPLAGHKMSLPSGPALGPMDRVACSGCGTVMTYQRMARVNGGVYCPACETRTTAHATAV